MVNKSNLKIFLGFIMNKIIFKKKLWLGIGIANALIVIPAAIIVPIMLTTPTQPVIQKFKVLDVEKSKIMFDYSSGPWGRKRDLTPANFEEYGILEIGQFALNSDIIPQIANLRNITFPSNPNFIIRNRAFAFTKFLRKVFIPEEITMEWMVRNEEYGYDLYGMFNGATDLLEVILPIKYKDSATAYKIGNNTPVFNNITWHGVYDINTQVPME